MKRSGPIKRKPEHQLKRSGPIKRTKPMPRQSKKRKELRKQVTPLEKEFLTQFPMCVYCGKRRATGIDHIARGSSRNAALSDRAAWNASCWTCNEGDANDHTKFPIERKIAVKIATDGEFASIEKINAMRGRAEDAITLANVSAWLEWR